jgi:hypothetical protein
MDTTLKLAAQLNCSEETVNALVDTIKASLIRDGLYEELVWKAMGIKPLSRNGVIIDQNGDRKKNKVTVWHIPAVGPFDEHFVIDGERFLKEDVAVGIKGNELALSNGNIIWL